LPARLGCLYQAVVRLWWSLDRLAIGLQVGLLGGWEAAWSFASS
jgi:hypothetical protein